MNSTKNRSPWSDVLKKIFETDELGVYSHAEAVSIYGKKIIDGETGNKQQVIGCPQLIKAWLSHLLECNCRHSIARLVANFVAVQHRSLLSNRIQRILLDMGSVAADHRSFIFNTTTSSFIVEMGSYYYNWILEQWNVLRDHTNLGFSYIISMAEPEFVSWSGNSCCTNISLVQLKLLRDQLCCGRSSHDQFGFPCCRRYHHKGCAQY